MNDLSTQLRDPATGKLLGQEQLTQPNQHDSGDGSATRHKQKQYLEAYSRCGSIVEAVEEVGIHRQTYYYWLADPEFERAAAEAEDWYTQRIRGKVIDRIDTTKNEMVRFYYTALELKKRDPSYKDNFKVEINLTNQIAAGDWGSAIDAAFSSRNADGNADGAVIEHDSQV